MCKKNSMTVHFKPIILPLSLSKSWRSELLLLVVTVTTLQCHFSGKSKMGSQWNTQTGTTLWASDVTQKPVQLTDFQKSPNSWISVVNFSVLLKFMKFLRWCWLPMIILLMRVIRNYQRITRMCRSISCSKMLDSFTSCQTTFLSLRSFICQASHMLLPFPGGFTNVCFRNSVTLLWRHNYHAEEIRKNVCSICCLQQTGSG